MKELDALRNYLTRPQDFWPAGARQAAKIDGRLARVEKALKTDRRGAIEEMMAVADFRARFAAPTIYIDSIGSSGSHWLQAMIGEMTPSLPAGEVYLPAQMFEELKRPSKRERRAILQGVYATHAYRSDIALITGNAINTAHSTSVMKYARHDGETLKILLVRNPSELVISRTFRKDEYKQYLGMEDVDAPAYLEANIKKVSEFFKLLRLEEFDMVVRYEALREDPADVLIGVAQHLGVSINDEQLKAAVNVEGETTNEFRGTRQPIPEHLAARAEEAMRPVADKFGY